MTDQRWTSVIPRSAVPVIIICHNLVTDLAKLVCWLEETGHERLVLLDNASTYPPMVSYLGRSSHQVIRLHENLGHRAPWLSGLVDKIGKSQPFVVTSPKLGFWTGKPSSVQVRESVKSISYVSLW
jgi:hypothetical protein